MPKKLLPLGAATAVITVLVTGCSDGGEPKPDKSRSASATGPSVPAAAPRTIPSVRSYEPGKGSGWKPQKDARVVGDGPLADEARRLAGELRMQYSSGPARDGDVQLELKRGQSGGPESYRLTVRDGRAVITGPDEAGVFYGTRTVLQGVRASGLLADGVVRDRPGRAQRGFQLDIARKHFTAGWIEARMREMADLKMNQLGLHFSDDQGFRLESTSHPEVVSEQHLTTAQLRRILDLAEDLHITVVPEIDSPGHLGAVIKAHPDLQLTSARGNDAPGAVDISDPQSAQIVDDLLREYARTFPGTYFHVGADEYAALMTEDPEASYPQLAAAAERKYGSGATVQDLATGWLNDRAKTVAAADKQPKAWNDGFFEGGKAEADKDIQVQYWTGKEIGARKPESYLREGRKLVNLNDEYLYYVLGEPNEFTYPTGKRIYEEWTPAVLRGTKPVPAGLAGPDRVLGGMFAVWCDLANAQTEQQVARGIRLPLAATAQKLWDPKKPQLSWKQFVGLADKVDPAQGSAS